MAAPTDSPISLKYTVEEDKLEMVELKKRVYCSYSDDDDDSSSSSSSSSYVPRIYSIAKFHGGHIESCLRLCHEFEHACGPENLALTGEERFSQFRLCLGSFARDKWDLCLSELGDMERNLAGFEHARTLFVESFASRNDLACIKQMLGRASKPLTMTVRKLFTRVCFLNLLLRFFPGCNGKPPYNSQALKECLFNMMLQPWKDKFRLLGHDLQRKKMTIQKLERIMTEQETAWNEQHPIKTKKNRNRSSQSRNYGSSQPQGRSSGPDRRRRRRNGNDSSNSGRNVRQRRGKGQDVRAKGGDCWYHPGHHDWIFCVANPHGPNYQPNDRPNQGPLPRPFGNGGNPHGGSTSFGPRHFPPLRDARSSAPPHPLAAPAPVFQPSAPQSAPSSDAFGVY